MPETIKVSILTLTFNHADYISRTIESFISQKTEFNYEIIISDDGSRDNNPTIINKLQKTHPNIIKPILRRANTGIVNNYLDSIKHCQGKYIAICEGDDYWTDPYKLQKQVAFLENNPDYSMVYTDIMQVNEHGEPLDKTNHFQKSQKKYASGDIFWQLIQGNFINTLTVTLRRKELLKILERLNSSNKPYLFDYWIWLHLSVFSKIMYLSDKTAAYRLHQNGISKKNKFLAVRAPVAKSDALIFYFRQNLILQRYPDSADKIWQVVKNLLLNKNLSLYRKIKLLFFFCTYLFKKRLIRI